MLRDKTLICRDCSHPYVFTAGEQGYFVDVGLLHEPTRCPTCREQRRHGRTRPRPETVVTCAECSAQTTVPFVPRLGRPVYCKPCFERSTEPAATASSR